MSVTDPIADFLTCIRNACKAKKETVMIPSSKMKVQIAEILKDEKFIKNFTVVEDGSKKFLKIYLKYLRNNGCAIKNLQKVSRPGLRRYVDAQKIPRVRNGLGVVVMSTSRGVVTGDWARKENVGGEVVCKIW